MTTYDVPFVENPDNHCLPAVIGMVIKYFRPDSHYTMAQLDELCGYQEGKATWKVLSMLKMAELGFGLYWVEDFDYEAFIADPKGYLRSILQDEAYEWQVAHADVELEARQMQDYLAKGLPFERRPGTDEDIRAFLEDGWLVHLEVNAPTLSGLSGYEGHSILIIGYDEEGVTIHNPDGKNGNKPGQHVSWELLDQAWTEFGGSRSLFAYRDFKSGLTA